MESVESKSLTDIQKVAENLFTGSSEALFLVSPENNLILDCNHNALLMFESDDKSNFVNLEVKKLNKKSGKKDFLLSSELDNFYKELEFITQKGKEFWGEMYIKKIDYNENKYYLIQISDLSEKLKIEAELAKNTPFIQRIANTSPNSIYVFDIKEKKIIYSNNKLSKELGYTYDEVKKMGQNYPACLMHHEDAIQYTKNLTNYVEIEDDEVYEHEYRLKDAKGRWHWVAFRSGVFSRNADNTIKEIIGTAQDITLRKQFEYDNLRLAAFPRANPNPVLECDFEGNITYINPSTHKLMISMNVTLKDLLHPNHHEICKQCKKNTEANREYDLVLKDKIMMWSYHPVSNIGYIHIYGFDITEKRNSENKLIHDALHDTLTNLPNRALFMDRLSNAFFRLKRKKGYSFAVLFLDLDRFKIVNDSLGHQAGDKLLMQLSKRLEEIIRPSDTVARLGGDEFTILIDDIQGIGDTLTVAERIKRSLSYPFQIDEHEIFTTASIGISLSTTECNNTPEEMMRNADMAMYKAKSKGKDRYEIFNSVMHIQAMNSLKLETELWKALEKDEFYLEYQPIIEFEKQTVTGFEALIRWNNANRGNVYPNEFIPVAEEAGLITHMDMWVLENVCKQIKVWDSDKLLNAEFSISINLSGKNFLNNNFTEKIKDIINKYSVNPSFLKFEITERVMLENNDHISSILSSLRKMNIQLQIDDFGTGYSSLSYLHRLPINALKIDKSFICNLGIEHESSEIVKTIIMLANNLGIYVIAEGIETNLQLEELKRLKCQFGQGHLFYSSLSTDKVYDLLKETV